ncbi:hypothetical protein ACQJBY_045291 [Aegilops geniculata]
MLGSWKMNADASYVGDAEPTCLGVVVRDHKGSVALSVCRRIQACGDAEEAEAEAIKMGSRELSDMYHGALTVESDCLSIINRQKLKSSEVDKSHLHHIVQDIKDLMEPFQSISWSATKREGNKVAHELASYARRTGEVRVVAGVPGALDELVFADSIPA